MYCGVSGGVTRSRQANIVMQDVMNRRIKILSNVLNGCMVRKFFKYKFRHTCNDFLKLDTDEFLLPSGLGGL